MPDVVITTASVHRLRDSNGEPGKECEPLTWAGGRFRNSSPLSCETEFDRGDLNVLFPGREPLRSVGNNAISSPFSELILRQNLGLFSGPSLLFLKYL